MTGKKLAILSLLVILILGVAGFWFYNKKMNAVNFRGIEFAVSGVEKEACNGWIETFHLVLENDEILKEIIKESNYSAKLEIPEGEAMEHLKSAAVVKFYKPRNAIQVGLKGKRKYRSELDEMAKIIFNVAAPVVAQRKPAFGRHYQGLMQGGQ